MLYQNDTSETDIFYEKTNSHDYLNYFIHIHTKQNNGLLNTQPYMSHLESKIKRPVFQKNQQRKRTESCIMCYLDLCNQQFFYLKDNVKSQNFKKVNIKNIKMKPPVAQFKKKSKKLCLFLKAKSQNLILSTVVCSSHKEKDVKKTVRRKIGKTRVF